MAEVTVFQLTNALLSRDREKAVRIFHELINDSETDIVGLIGILHWQLRSLWQGAALLEDGVSESEMLSRTKIQPYRQRPFMAAVRGFGVRKLEIAVEALYQLDKQSKVGQAEGTPGLESWLLQYAA